VELAGGVMEELAKAGGLRNEVVTIQCQEFMQVVKVMLLSSFSSSSSSS
jgi:mediator of RNA polymerase II transcription subunit 11